VPHAARGRLIFNRQYHTAQVGTFDHTAQVSSRRQSKAGLMLSSAARRQIFCNSGNNDV
jgi:hypothetical protein